MCYARKRKVSTHIIIRVKKMFEQDHWNVKIKKNAFDGKKQLNENSGEKER